MYNFIVWNFIPALLARFLKKIFLIFLLTEPSGRDRRRWVWNCSPRRVTTPVCRGCTAAAMDTVGRTVRSPRDRLPARPIRRLQLRPPPPPWTCTTGKRRQLQRYRSRYLTGCIRANSKGRSSITCRPARPAARYPPRRHYPAIRTRQDWALCSAQPIRHRQVSAHWPPHPPLRLSSTRAATATTGPIRLKKQTKQTFVDVINYI